MNIIHAAGALRKFLDARSRGASHQELKRLYAACEAEKPKVAARPTPRRSEQRESTGGKIYQSEKNDRKQRICDVVVYLERAKLEREWESAPD
jgi:hypothetical protein